MILATLISLMLTAPLDPVTDSVDYRLTIRTIPVTERSIRQTGTQITTLDSTVLRDSPSMSLAEVLAQNSTIFVKSYGRGTLATPSMRGTSAAHTRVLWNGLELNSPMLGSVDLSTIPSYLVDNAEIYHGASSVGVTSGGLGGAVTLSTERPVRQGWGLQFVHGVGSFATVDDILRVDYTADRISTSTRVTYSYSRNNFKYTNYNKRTDIRYNPDGSIASWSYPEERNLSGSWSDFHVVEQLSVNLHRAGTLGLNVWYSALDRGIPMLNVSYRDSEQYSNTQKEQTLRSVVQWQLLDTRYKLSASAGHIYTDLRYRYTHDTDAGHSVRMIDSGNFINSITANTSGEYYLGRKWLFEGSLSLRQDMVSSHDYRHGTVSDSTSGYNSGRFTADVTATVKWRPTERLSAGVVLREQLVGKVFSPVMPALYVDYVLSPKGGVVMKASATRNFRYPSLNDLYYKPGGNPDLKPEKGFSYDAGIEFSIPTERIAVSGSATWFDSYISDWILWLPTFNGYWSPINVSEVHSYGIETKLNFSVDLGRGWNLGLNGNFAWTPSINHGDATSWSDASRGKQLVYVPLCSSGIVGRILWRGWEFSYRWNYYSRRYTTSSNQTASRYGSVAPYFMNDVSLSKTVVAHWGRLTCKFTVNNLFNEQYESVLSRPMPRQNYYFTLEFTPRIGGKATSPQKHNARHDSQYR